MTANETEELVRRAAHDLKGPVRRMSSFAGFLREDLGDALTDDVERDLRYIIEGAEELNGLLEGLTDLALAGCQRLQAQKSSLTQCVVRAHEALGEAGDSLTVVADEEVAAWADPTALTKVCGRLLEAAVWLAGGQAVTASVRRSGAGEALLELDAPGLVLAEDDRRNVFEPFYKIGERPHDPKLRLASCHSAVVRMGGRLEAEQSDAGLRLLLTLPAGPPETAQT
ncbi:MAG: hypothetical protein GC160_07985 [Acidobacteria bacterium]|nr:hypothetical protein [Acidobacteriota bacterium]